MVIGALGMWMYFFVVAFLKIYDTKPDNITLRNFLGNESENRVIFPSTRIRIFTKNLSCEEIFESETMRLRIHLIGSTLSSRTVRNKIVRIAVSSPRITIIKQHEISISLRLITLFSQTEMSSKEFMEFKRWFDPKAER